MREGVDRGGTAVVAGAVIGEGGTDVCVAVHVGSGAKVSVGSCIGDDSISTGVGMSVLVTCPKGWKGVGVGEGFGACVIKMNVENEGGVDCDEAQAARRVMTKK